MKRKKTGKILMIAALIFLVLIGAGFSYLYSHGMSGISRTADPAEGQVRIACVGDSITYGHGTTSWPKNTYPVTLQGLLGECFHVNSYGVSGRCVQVDSDQPYTALKHYRESLTYKADIVVFMMGTNDSKPENWHGAAEYQAALEALLDSYAGSEILLCTPAAAFFMDGSAEGATSHDIQPAVVEEIAEITRTVAEQREYTLADIHTLTAANPQWFAADGVHPDNEGSAAIAAEIHRILTGEQA